MSAQSKPTGDEVYETARTQAGRSRETSGFGETAQQPSSSHQRGVFFRQPLAWLLGIFALSVLAGMLIWRE